MCEITIDEDWDIIETFLPVRWQWQAKKTGAVRRMRGVRGYANLLRLLMLHISGGLSLEQAVMRAGELGIARVSAMALHKRLSKARPWFEWMCERLMVERKGRGFDDGVLAGRRVLAVDGSDIKEPGATGSSWHLHYAIELPNLRCAHAQFDTQAESLRHYPVRAADIVMADRGYARRSQLAWLIEQEADAIIRISPNHFPVEESARQDCLKFDWLRHLKQLKGYRPGEWTVCFTHEGRTYTVRICAVRKSLAAQKKALHAIETEARKKNRTIKPETREYAKYVIVLTTLPKTLLDTRAVLELYRCRWQIELAFKRLKSLLEAGCGPKNDPATALAWMQGKLLEALLVEKLLEKTECFSPWGHAF
ncbi:MAG: IS4 family transposase [Opitutaceae bacterium]|nr:IS4 family transposase [Opitutaceae bacterium]